MPLIQPKTPQQPVENQPIGRRERGTGFTNIQRLLGANVGAGQKMGSAIGQSLGAKAGQLSEDVTRAGKAFQDRYADSTRKQEDAFKVAEGLIPSSVEGISGESGLGSMDEETAKSIGKQLAEAKTYQGPMGIENSSQLESRAKSIGGLGELARSGTSGQGLLLQGIAGKAKPYTRGQSALDTFLLGQSKEAQKDIKQAAAQTAGAEQQAQTVASGAEQQAKEGSKALSARGTDILRKAAESSQNIKKYGEEQGKEYVRKATRLAELMNKAGQINPETGKPFIDPNDLSPEDLDLINTAENFGVNTGGIYVDPRERYSYLSKAVLAGFTRNANLAEGGLKLNEEQKNAMKNLAFLQQQAAPTIGEFATKRFGQGDVNTELDALKSEQQRAIDQLKAREAINIVELKPRGLTFTEPQYEDFIRNRIAPWRRQLFDYDWLKNAIESGKKNVVFTNPGMTEEKQSIGDMQRAFGRFLPQSEANLENERLAQKGITLGNYLKRLYGINSEGSGQV